MLKLSFKRLLGKGIKEKFFIIITLKFPDTLDLRMEDGLKIAAFKSSNRRNENNGFLGALESVHVCMFMNVCVYAVGSK